MAMELADLLVDVQTWNWEHMRKYPGAGIPRGSMRKWELLGRMREMVSKPGEDIHSVVPLVWHRGEKVQVHVHPEHTVIFYVALGDPPVPIILGRDENDKGELYTPEPGETLVLPPDTLHGVPRSMSATPRLAIAMRVNKQ